MFAKTTPLLARLITQISFKIIYSVVFIDIFDSQSAKFSNFVESRVFCRSYLPYQSIIFQLRESDVDVASALIYVVRYINRYIPPLLCEAFQYQEVSRALQLHRSVLIRHALSVGYSDFLQAKDVTNGFSRQLLPPVIISSCSLQPITTGEIADSALIGRVLRNADPVIHHGSAWAPVNTHSSQ